MFEEIVKGMINEKIKAIRQSTTVKILSGECWILKIPRILSTSIRVIGINIFFGNLYNCSEWIETFF